jgi:hypothetical protein
MVDEPLRAGSGIGNIILYPPTHLQLLLAAICPFLT